MLSEVQLLENHFKTVENEYTKLHELLKAEAARTAEAKALHQGGVQSGAPEEGSAADVSLSDTMSVPTVLSALSATALPLMLTQQGQLFQTSTRYRMHSGNNVWLINCLLLFH